jgi:hypothetical protein
VRSAYPTAAILPLPWEYFSFARDGAGAVRAAAPQNKTHRHVGWDVPCLIKAKYRRCVLTESRVLHISGCVVYRVGIEGTGSSYFWANFGRWRDRQVPVILEY